MKKPRKPAPEAMTIESWPIDRPKPYPKNARKLSDQAVAKCAASIKAFGWRQPIVVDSKGVVIAGHTRLLAGQSLGLAEVPVHVAAGLSPAQVRAYRLADNRTAQETSWDLELLGPELLELQALDLDLSLTGFDPDELKMYMSPGIEGLTDPDACPEAQAQAISVPGDLWLLGEHRVLCGDSTNVTDVERLMAGGLEKADLVFTDPPYGVGYDGGTTVREKLAGDDNTALYGPACMMAAMFSDDQAALYLWHAGVKGIAAAAAAAAAAAGYTIRCELVWNKNLAQFGALSAQYKQKHEPAYYCHKTGKAPRWFGPTNEVTVWDCDRAQANTFHPTQKPVALAERAAANSSAPGDIVLDLFGGSGSTLMACETTGRKARLIEIAPQYVDVICRRWMAHTGRAAVLAADCIGAGRSFAELEAERTARSAV